MILACFICLYFVQNLHSFLQKRYSASKFSLHATQHAGIAPNVKNSIFKFKFQLLLFRDSTAAVRTVLQYKHGEDKFNE